MNTTTTTTADIYEEAEKLLRLVQQIDSTIEEAAAQARFIDDLADGVAGRQLQRLQVAVSEEARSLAILIAMEDGDTYTPGLAAREARDLLDLIDLGRTERSGDA